MLINYSELQRLNAFSLLSLLVPFYPTHSCQTSPPKTPIFVGHFSKTSFLAFRCLKNGFKCFCLTLKALCDVNTPKYLTLAHFFHWV